MSAWSVFPKDSTADLLVCIKECNVGAFEVLVGIDGPHIGLEDTIVLTTSFSSSLKLLNRDTTFDLSGLECSYKLMILRIENEDGLPTAGSVTSISIW